jgi:hydrogenase-4 component E
MVDRPGDILLLLVLLTDFAVLVTDRLSACIRIMATQGVLLALLPIWVAPRFSAHLLALVLGTLAIKAVVLPRVLQWAIREAAVRRELDPAIGYGASVMLGLGAVGIAFLVSTRLTDIPDRSLPLLVPVSLASLMLGFLVLTTRRKALSQVIGYLMLENGIFLFGLTLANGMPLLVEMGVLLDVFVGVFIMGLVLFQISRELETLDSRRLSELKD